jgi:hypothetical protein
MILPKSSLLQTGFQQLYLLIEFLNEDPNNPLDPHLPLPTGTQGITTSPIQETAGDLR